ncbi:MAG: Mov34/MPN/PAD-1 family protein [Thaumarchaeota archaeon]|nr:Mov34/MPN/PAD-1 family protein [Nitrososphaerota archaeon]
MPIERAVFAKSVADSLLSFSQMAYPKEGILLLRGKVKKGIAEVSGVVIPPAAVHGESMSSFSWWMLPIDLTFLGVAHSHPSGNVNPSQEDLLHISGRIMVIVGYPFVDSRFIAVYNSKGEKIPMEVK